MQERSHRALRASGTSGTGLSPKAAAEVLCEVVFDLNGCLVPLNVVESGER